MCVGFCCWANIPHSEHVVRLDSRRLQFDLPGPVERRRLLALFLAKYVGPGTRIRADPDATGGAALDELAALTEGMSGRSLEKLCISAQGRAFGGDGGGEGGGQAPVLTREMLLDVARAKVKQFARRREMAEEETSFV